MARFLVTGGIPLKGTITANGSKNSALPIITAAALAAEGESVLENVPRYTDILDLCEILRQLGARVEWDGSCTLRVAAPKLTAWEAPYHLARKLRGSTYVVGLLLARRGQAEVAVPGGCDIGARPVDFHLRGFRSLGAETRVEHGSILAQASRLEGTVIFVDRASVGTTVNLMITASLASGTTVLENAAREPEIVDLANFLNGMGGHVRGAGTNVIRIEGVEVLHGTRHEVIPDRIEAGTYLIAGVATGGRVRVENAIPEHLRTVLAKLEEAGAQVAEGTDWVEAWANGRLQAVDIQTQPYPGFPTDLQSPFVSLLSVAEGVSVVEETIFDNRFGFANELIRMGADIKVERNTALVRGGERLTGAPIEARDIRGGAALMVAGLSAEGETEIGGMRHIDRGYHAMEEKLTALGARVRRGE
ncbi:MAG: UDP-N-acetylglucosamine 1-carboxyvinyltransferase [Thermaerobacter sp.]|nr:UDP-N-acetylglucosamine 1-carboxyvinyltransferase [Thermaerobacter sp.]